MPKISAVMPVYNGDKFISKAIESIISQTMQDWELIIVDDGSSDNTVQIVSHYLAVDSRIRLIKINRSGRGIARNISMEAARGEIIAICDADDISLKSRFEISYEVLSSDENIQIVSCGILPSFYGDDPSVFNTFWPSDPNLILNGLRSGKMTIAHPGVSIRKSAFEAFGPYDTNLIRAQDMDFLRRFATVDNISILQRPLVLYRVNGKSVSIKTFMENEFHKGYTNERQKFADFEEYSDSRNLVHATISFMKYIKYFLRNSLKRVDKFNSESHMIESYNQEFPSR